MSARHEPHQEDLNPKYTQQRQSSLCAIRGRKVTLNVISPTDDEIHSHRFKQSEICALSNTISRACKQSRGDVVFKHISEHPNFFANYARWVRERNLPVPKVRCGGKVDIMQFYLDLHQLGEEMEDSRLITRCREEFIELFHQGLLSSYSPSIRAYVETNHDTLRTLFIDFFVVDFSIREFAEKGLDLPFAFCRDVLRATNAADSKEKARKRLENPCYWFHHHDPVRFSESECHVAESWVVEQAGSIRRRW